MYICTVPPRMQGTGHFDILFAFFDGFGKRNNCAFSSEAASKSKAWTVDNKPLGVMNGLGMQI